MQKVQQDYKCISDWMPLLREEELANSSYTHFNFNCTSGCDHHHILQNSWSGAPLRRPPWMAQPGRDNKSLPSDKRHAIARNVKTIRLSRLSGNKPNQGFRNNAIFLSWPCTITSYVVRLCLMIFYYKRGILCTRKNFNNAEKSSKKHRKKWPIFSECLWKLCIATNNHGEKFLFILSARFFFSSATDRERKSACPPAGK